MPSTMSSVLFHFMIFDALQLGPLLTVLRIFEFWLSVNLQL